MTWMKCSFFATMRVTLLFWVISMLNILGLFGRSPFAPLQSHMDFVSQCVHTLPELVMALKKKDEALLFKLSEKISGFEQDADLIKNDIRNHLPKSLFLPIPRESLLEILSIQDRIADRAEDTAVLVTLKPLDLLPSFEREFDDFLQKNIETFEETKAIVNEMHELVESSFGGIEAARVRSMVDAVAYREHETDILQRDLLRKIFHCENELDYASFYQWLRLVEHISAISNLSENLSYRIRMILEIK